MNRRSAQANVLYTKTTITYLNELVDILYEKQYFSFEKSAIEYVSSLRQEMEAIIHFKQKQLAPTHFLRYGKNLYYISYPKNKRTTWYFFFTYHPKQNIYFIRYITNNHVAGHLLE